ncbi:MAG: hypothetical protein M3O46_16020, partial [Myxococcota bacterium]|nr:hypothetical protein [Myxococcota bacterium]
GYLVRSALRTSAVSAVAAVAGWAAARLATSRGLAAGSLLPGAAGTAAFGIVFLVGAWGMRSTELEEILAAARHRLTRRKA